MNIFGNWRQPVSELAAEAKDLSCQAGTVEGRRGEASSDSLAQGTKSCEVGVSSVSANDPLQFETQRQTFAGELDRLKQDGRGFAIEIASIIFARAGGKQLAINASNGIELALLLADRMNQLNNSEVPGRYVKPGSEWSRRRLSAFLEGINLDLRSRGYELRVDLGFDLKGQILFHQAHLYLWNNGQQASSPASPVSPVMEASIPQESILDLTHLQAQADQVAHAIVASHRLPANGNPANQSWLQNELGKQFGRLGPADQGGSRVSVFMMMLALKLRRFGYDVVGPMAAHVQFFQYDNLAHLRGEAISPRLEVGFFCKSLSGSPNQ
jgi:hypothetical protein